MGTAFAWWLAIEILGVVSLPLAATVLRNLPDRGWALAKPLGLVALGWLIWFPLSVVTALPYSSGWIFGTFLAFALVNLALLRRPGTRAALGEVWARARAHVIAAEALFAAGFVFMALVRAFSPDVRDTEKFMDVAFISSLWRTPHLPAPDPWLSGYPINYYYFGHFLVATVAKVLGTQPGTAFNVGIALIFALVAVAVYGVAANLTAVVRRGGVAGLSRSVVFGLAGVFLVLVAGNLNGAQIWWKDAMQAAQYTVAMHGNPWAWWGQRTLWLGYDWWSPSRVITGTINEFPAFSFVLADLHAHVLALPFAALAVGIALNLLLARGEGLRAFGAGRLLWLAAGVSAVALGSLYAMNGWDLPTYLGLALLAIAIQQWIANSRRLTTRFLLNTFAAGAVLVALSILLYVPFYRGFVSPSEGFAPVLPADRSMVGDELAIFGLPLFLALSLVAARLVRWTGDAGAAYLSEEVQASAVGERGTFVAWLASARTLATSVAVLALLVLALLTARTAANQGWTLFWAMAILVGCAALVLRRLAGRAAVEGDGGAAQADGGHLGELWLFCLIGVAAALVAACELVYLRDIFGTRMNTVFKLYYQAWLLLGIAGAPALALLSGTVRRALGAAMPASRATVAAQTTVSSPVALAAGGGSGSARMETRRLDAAVAATADTPPATTADSTPESVSAAGHGEGRPVRAAAGFPVALRWARAGGMLLWTAALLALVGTALVYPVLAFSARTGNFGWRPGAVAPFAGISTSGGPLTLDGTAYMATDSAQAPADCATVGAGSNRGDNAAIDWLNRTVSGSPVIVEAPGCEWTRYSRVSAFTGLPTLLGWPGGHEGEWRASWLAQQSGGDLFGARKGAIDTIYTSQDSRLVLALLQKYDARYVYVGVAERNLYQGANLDRFGSFLRQVYSHDGVTIYAAP